MASGSKAVIYAALAGNSAIAVTKFVASALTGSSAMLTEAIHSLVDTGNQVLLLWGLSRAKQPPDEEFPFGRGKEIYFWSFVVAISIFALGAGVSVIEGVKHLVAVAQDPDHAQLKDLRINYVVLGLAMLFEGGALTFALREFNKARGELGFFEAIREGKDPSMFLVVFEDAAAMAGLVVAFLALVLGQLTHNPYLDGAASVVIGLILGAVAIVLARETKGLIIGESASSQVRQGIRKLVQGHPIISHLNELLTMHMGPDNVLVTMSVDFIDGLASEEVEREVQALNAEIKAAFPSVRRVFIEVESWVAHKAQVERAHELELGAHDDEHDDDDEHEQGHDHD